MAVALAVSLEGKELPLMKNDTSICDGLLLSPITVRAKMKKRCVNFFYHLI